MKKIKIINGVPNFCVDGEIITPAAYMTYLTQNATYGAFYNAGVRLFCLEVQASSYPANEEAGLSAGFAPGMWKDENTFDFSSLDSDVSRIFEQTGDRSVKIMLRINLNMPKWWRERNPEELTLFTDGKQLMQSIFSKKWRIDVCKFLDALKRHIETAGYNGNVIAWQPAAMHTEEWIAPCFKGVVGDISAPAKNAFISFLRNKYTKIGVLNKAWNTDYFDFNEVSLPTAEEFFEVNGQIKEKTRDYFVCMNQAYAETADYFCAYVKRIFKGDIFAGCFSGYIAQLDYYRGHCAFSKLLKSKNVDFFASPFAYTLERANAEDWFYHAPMESARKAGKLWFMEADVRTHKTQLLSKYVPHLFPHKLDYYEGPVWLGPDEKNSYYNMLRSFAKVFISRNAFWWFDMFGGWYEYDAYMELIKKTYDLYENELFNKVENTCEVAVVLDENSSYYTRNDVFWKGVYDKMISFGYLGTPYDLLISDNLKSADLKRYKTVIFTAPVITDKFKKLVNSLKKKGKTVIITGKYSENIDMCSAEITLDDSKIFNLVNNSGAHIYSAGNIVYANEKYLSVTARHDGTLSINMPYNCELIDCITKEKLKTVDCSVLLEAKLNQTFLFEIIR